MAENLLKGKKGIVFGALNDQSIAWKTAIQAHAQGAELVLTNAPVAMRMGEINELSKLVGNAPVIGADATSVEDLTALFEGAMEHFGGQVDFVLHSIGMSPNVRKGRHYTDVNYNWLQTTLDVSAISLHKTLAVAKKNGCNSGVGKRRGIDLYRCPADFPRLWRHGRRKKSLGKYHPEFRLPLRRSKKSSDQYSESKSYRNDSGERSKRFR
jgi:hypothetical protein